MLSTDLDDRTTTADPPLWTIPLAMLLVGLLAVTVGVVGALTGGRTGNDRTVRITGTGLLQQQPGSPMVLCVGASGDSQPASCGTTVALTGVSWRDVGKAELHGDTTEGWATLTGTLADGVLHVETVGEPQLVTPVPVERVPEQLCLEPGGTTTKGEIVVGPKQSVLESIPGFQGHWVTDGGTPSGGDGTVSVHNVAIRGNVARAEQLIRTHFDGPLCVGTIPGATHAELTDAMARLTPKFAELGLLGGNPSLVGGRAGLDLQVFVITPEIEQRIDQVLGPEVARWTTIQSQFRVVD